MDSKQFSKGNQVTGRYMGVEFAGTVRSVRMRDVTGLVEIEIDFPAPIQFRHAEDIRTGLILTNLGEDDYLKVAA